MRYELSYACWTSSRPLRAGGRPLRVVPDLSELGADLSEQLATSPSWGPTSPSSSRPLRAGCRPLRAGRMCFRLARALSRELSRSDEFSDSPELLVRVHEVVRVSPELSGFEFWCWTEFRLARPLLVRAPEVGLVSASLDLSWFELPRSDWFPPRSTSPGSSSRGRIGLRLARPVRALGRWSARAHAGACSVGPPAGPCPPNSRCWAARAPVLLCGCVRPVGLLATLSCSAACLLIPESYSFRQRSSE